MTKTPAKNLKLIVFSIVTAMLFMAALSGTASAGYVWGITGYQTVTQCSYFGCYSYQIPVYGMIYVPDPEPTASPTPIPTPIVTPPPTPSPSITPATAITPAPPKPRTPYFAFIFGHSDVERYSILKAQIPNKRAVYYMDMIAWEFGLAPKQFEQKYINGRGKT